MPRPNAISLVPGAIRPPPINLERPLLLLEAAIAASAPGIWSIRAWTLSEGPSLRRKPRTTPMVFSATTLSMPALVASRPINSSIVPRPHPVCYRVVLGNDLERLRSEIQAISVHRDDFNLDREASVAAMQECARDSRYVVAPRLGFPAGRWRKV